MAGWRHRLPNGRGWHFRVVRGSNRFPNAHLYPRFLAGHHAACARIYDRLPAAGMHDDRRILRLGFRAFLSVLRRRFDSDVSDHRGLGRASAGLFLVQVFSIHSAGFGIAAAGNDLHVF